jgi:hypothetical protein
MQIEEPTTLVLVPHSVGQTLLDRQRAHLLSAMHQHKVDEPTKLLQAHRTGPEILAQAKNTAEAVVLQPPVQATQYVPGMRPDPAQGDQSS